MDLSILGILCTGVGIFIMGYVVFKIGMGNND